MYEFLAAIVLFEDFLQKKTLAKIAKLETVCVCTRRRGDQITLMGFFSDYVYCSLHS